MREIGFKRMRQLKNKLIALMYEIATKGFVAGFVLGISMTYLETPAKIPSFSTNFLAYKNRIIGLHQPNTEPLADVREPENVTLNSNTGTNSSESTISAKRDRILCWILTHPKTHSRARLIKETWGKRCNVLLFMSSIKGKHGTIYVFN